MATPAQITANRANAQHSTGPRSAEGKSASRFNALKHGVDAASIALPGEDPDAYQALADSYAHDYVPNNVAERFLVDSMLRADWQKQRLQRLEAELLQTLFAETPGASLLSVTLSDSPAAKLLARTQRQLAAHERAWFRAHREIIRLRAIETRNREEGFQRYINHLAPEHRPAELASFPQKPDAPEPPAAPAPQTAKSWPPVDEKTGKPLYFVG